MIRVAGLDQRYPKLTELGHGGLHMFMMNHSLFWFGGQQGRCEATLGVLHPSLFMIGVAYDQGTFFIWVYP